MRAWAVLLLFALPAGAQDLPALYAVEGVAANDVLNIRLEPEASAEKIGELAYDAAGVEIVRLSPDGDWGLVNTGEQSGWTSMRYLAAESDLPWHSMENALSCFGTEPFWNLTVPAEDGPLVMERMGEGSMGFGRTVTSPAFGTPPNIGFALQGPAREGFAVIGSAACNDGMSDRDFGLSFDMFLAGPNGPESYRGCCSLAN